MTAIDSKKAPVAQLGGTRDEGLNPTISIYEEAGTPMVEPRSSTRITLDDSTHVDIDVIDGSTEVTITTVNGPTTRSMFGVALSPGEVGKLVSALLDATAPQFGVATDEEIEVHCDKARRTQALITREDAPSACSPAQLAKRQRDLVDEFKAAGADEGVTSWS